MRPRFYRIMRLIARFLMTILFPIRRKGLENVPEHGAVMLCSNHISLIDPVALGCAMRRPVRFMAKRELFSVKWFARFLNSVGAFPVARGDADISAMRTSLALLREGEVMGIYPQGHRYKRDEEMFVAGGAALIALKTRATVIPIFMSKYRLFRFLHIRIGAPVSLKDLWGKIDADSLDEAARRITEGIWGGGCSAPTPPPED